MIIDSKYTKTFVSDKLTRQKYDELMELAVKLREHKNLVSEFVNNDLFKYLKYKKLEFLKEMRTTYKNVVSSSFDYQLYIQVFDSYQNKFNAIQRNLKFENIEFQRVELYKRDTKKNKKGDFKKVVNKKTDTPLSMCLTYLARYGNEGILNYINEQMSQCDENKREFYKNILRCCGKFGFDRLYALALQRRTRVINHYAKYPIKFESLTFSGRSRKTRIIDYNKNFGSIRNAFVSLSGFGRKNFDIPVKFCKDYHGRMQDYLKKNPDYEYTIVFNERKHQVKINLCKDGERFIPEAGNNLVGIDVNCKHNLFSLSDGTTYDYDRELLKTFCDLSTIVDQRKKQDKEYVPGKRLQRKLDALKLKITKSEEYLVAGMCKTLMQQGCDHIVMEDLDNSFGKCYVKDKENSDINYNRKVKFLGLSSLKDMVEHIARKYGIAVSTVHPSYTSKMCPICGCIEDENRPDQETFSCVECGHSENADINAAINIRNRVTETVFRDKLLKQLGNGAYEPKALKREKVKEVLLSFRRSLAMQGCECLKA